jgi:protein Tex
VHPESYPVVRRILARTGTDVPGLIGNTTVLRGLRPAEFTDEAFGLPTVNDILKELEKPGRDPRPEFQTATFAEGVHTLEDLEPGMVLEGVVTNVAAFGAFVDIGVHQDGLVHVSAMSASYVSDPRSVAKPGDVVRVKVQSVDIPRHRISLTMRLDDPGASRPSSSRTDGGASPDAPSSRGAGNRRGGRSGPGGDRRGAGSGSGSATGSGSGSATGSGSAGDRRGGQSAPASGSMAEALRRAGLVSDPGKPRRRDDRP